MNIKMQSLVVFSVLFVTINAVSFTDLISEEWELYKIQFGKKYETELEDRFRMKIYMEKRHKIAVHNKRYERGEVTYKMGLNQFGDKLPDELSKMFGYRMDSSLFAPNITDNAHIYIPPYNFSAPDEVDWSKEGYVTPIKNQGSCGSCWAFSATGALEGQIYRSKKTLVSLSEQNLMDCSRRYGNNGCNGGRSDWAFQYIADNHGIDTESSYPYQARDGTCHYNPAAIGATDKGYKNILPRGNEETLKIAVANIGPISVAIDANHEAFFNYRGDVYFNPQCSSTNLDHAVLVVGYGTSKHGDYWLVKNSWGENWGIRGYAMMARNKNNACGIATEAYYPEV